MIENIKKYISANKYLKNGILICSMIFLLTLLTLSIQEKKNSRVNELKIDIQYSDSSKKLINNEFLAQALQRKLGYDIERVKIADVDILSIERFFNNNTYIDSAEVYIDARNNVVAEIIQKNPIVRVNTSTDQFYLDDKGEYLKLSPIASVRVPVITGKVGEYDPVYKLEEKHQYKDIYEIAMAIHEDEFLTALIEQIHVEKNDDFLLIPKIGKEKIILGDTYDLDGKLFNLKGFYKEGLTRVGWGKYAYLDLKDQGRISALRE